MIEEELSGSIFAQSKRIEIVAKSPINLQQYIRKEDPSILTSNILKRYKSQLKAIVFIFQIKYKNRHWQLLKKFPDFLDFGHLMRKKLGREIPTLPIHKESQLSDSNMSNFADFLLIFLRKICDIGINDDQVRHFLQILPQKYGTGIIYAEIRLSKLSGGRYTEATCARRVKNFICCRNWRKRYFTITDECIFYTANKKSYEIKQMLPFSQNFKILCGQNSTGFQLGIILKSSYRQLELKAHNLYDFALFVCQLKKSLANCSFCQENRFSSYASIRSLCSSKYYIDGQNYFGDVCDEILNAKQSVYITGWMITPYMLLRRPRQLDDRSSRLDYILQSAAQRGVKVYIIIYMEPKIALNNDSEFVEYYLEDLHRNIRVLRHPNYILVPFLWSHHEKIIVIDQKCGFLGGLDLCYGRWDNQKHYLHNENNLWKGADFCNFRKSDIYQPRNFLRSNLDHFTHPRMPWHDVAVQIKGDSVIDLSRHFVQYWNFVSFQTKFDDRQLLIQAGHYSYHRKKTDFRIKNPFKAQSRNSTMENKSQLNEKLSSQINQQDQYYEKFLEKRNILQIPRINRQTISRNLHEIKQYPKKLLNYLEGQQFTQRQERLMIYHLAESKLRYGQQRHQILRSASLWSLGLQADKHQMSIYYAYQDLIKNAKEFIYIQNQFFICKTNIICQLLAERIIKAYRKKEKFKIMILLPLLPGFEGQIMDQSSAVMRIQLLYQYQTVVRSKDSLLSRISQIPDPQKYIQILSLRTHSLTLSNTPVTQILYIHTKLMIIDDSKVILGSANINDRSLLGDRDSEIGIVIEEQKEGLFDLNGRKVSRSANRLRSQLYKEHFNISIEEAEDYWNEQVWDRIRKKAENNTKIYREIFGCYPDNQMKTFKDIESIKQRSNVQRYKELGKKIDGSVVVWPMFFLQKQDLNLKPSQKEYYIPMINFT